MQLKVQDYPDLVRDSKSKGILNVNQNALKEHLSKQKLRETIESVQEEVTAIKSDLEEMKNLLKQLVAKV
jgi:hypothetical protein